ncbi:Pleckstrin homology domain-containing protein [Lipomyces arxii]|uniref:Pleckstrin homology domain-containing protein n=1 Tax=Lipomyces arxii TaxID=56418 RepID=UPI0034CF282A
MATTGDPPISQLPDLPSAGSPEHYPFTSFRLSHAKPEHMHTTSRVVLVGPIPSEWLQRNQKSWLARVARSSDTEFKAAWSSAFPDSDPPPRPKAMSIKTAPRSLRAESIAPGSYRGNLMSSSSFKTAPGIPIAGSSRPVSFVIDHGSPSQRHSPYLSSSPIPSKSIPVPIAGSNVSNVDLNGSSLSKSIPGSPKRVQSSYFADDHLRVTPKSSPTPDGSTARLSALDAHRNSSPNPFSRYDNTSQVEIPSTSVRGRSLHHYKNSIQQPSSVFAPSSYTSNQSFETARSSSIGPSTGRSVSYHHQRSHSASTSQLQIAESEDGSQESETSTIRPLRTIPTPIMTSVSSMSINRVGDNIPLRIQPHFHIVPRNAAKSSLSTILQRDDEIRRIRNSSIDGNSESESLLHRDRQENDGDDDAFGRVTESLHQVDFNFYSRERAHEHEEHDMYDAVVDGNSILGAVGPELAMTGNRSEEYKLQIGQVVKIDRVLVAIKSANVRTLPPDFNESAHVHLNAVERAREYISVARYTGNEDVPFVLQLFKTMTVPAIVSEQISSSIAHTIPLDRRLVSINLFSSLDKSIALWRPTETKKSVSTKTTLYLLRFRMPSTSIAWYGFLRAVLGGKMAKEVVVQVPDLEASVRIVVPWDDVRKYNMQRLAASRRLEEANNYHDNPVLQIESAVDTGMPTADISDYIISTALDILDRVEAYREQVSFWREHEQLSLAWRRYDRIEWVHDVNEQHMYAAYSLRKTHELELRSQVHYPTFAPNPAERAKSLVEPPPLEGFLIRLTQHSGASTKLGRLFYKQFYFMTHDNMLLFCKPDHATPPAFEKPFSLTDSVSSRAFVHEFTPYPMKDGHIEWLDGTRVRDAHKLKELDEIALSEVYRRLYQILTSVGFIDMCDVEEVRKVKRDREIDAEIGVGSGADFNRPGPNASTNHEDGVTTEFDDDRVFELVLKSGLVIRLQAFNKITRDEWIKRLDELRLYWRARMVADARALNAVKADNLAQLHIDEEMESQIGEASSKWEALRGVADPQIYNICPLGSCRSVTMKGSLFLKIRKETTFNLSYVVICHGHIVVYEEQSRAANGVEIPKIYHKKRDLIPLQECYVYSGIMTESDLIQANSMNIGAAPGMYSLPRIYRDGTTASDDEYSRCFVLWRAKTTKVLLPQDANRSFRSKHAKTAGSNKFYSVGRMGTAGTPLIFMARSRMEKELWVSVLTDEIGRIQEKGVAHHVLPA